MEPVHLGEPDGGETVGPYEKSQHLEQEVIDTMSVKTPQSTLSTVVECYSCDSVIKSIASNEQNATKRESCSMQNRSGTAAEYTLEEKMFTKE